MRDGPGKRSRILDAACVLFRAHGVRGTSMEAIARAAGIAKPTLYGHFHDKDEVLASLKQLKGTQNRTAFGSALQGAGDIAGRVASALTVRERTALTLRLASPHAAQLQIDAEPPVPDADVGRLLEEALRSAGVGPSRQLAQVLLAASSGIGQKAQAPAELGPALRLIAERLIRPELET